MTRKNSARHKAIVRRRIFIGLCALILALVTALIVFIVAAVTSRPEDGNTSDIPSSSEQTGTASSSVPSGTSDEGSDNNKSDAASSETDSVNATVNGELNPKYTNLLLVNGENPLPENYDTDVRKDLVEIDAKYRNNNYVTQIHKDVYPYITAMVAAAQADGVDLRVWSPFRSYAIQKDLFQKQVNRVGGDEAKAATVVARPGTSEHNTGLCADFNMASDAFENTEMYRWMVENAENYGFIMRYSEEKQPITGVIHESWHWRFVGINAAKEINDLGMCLEEYVEYLQKETS
ncbi:MAG: M15 family metallopeptidase [Clostridia bacterium]|nr:M15 family metallopeptidase [Clostridia bacterium]